MYPSVKQYIYFEELTFTNHLRTNNVLKWSRPNKWVMYRCYEFHAILFSFFFVIVGMVILAQLLQLSSCWKTMPLDLSAIWATVQVNVLWYNTQHCLINCSNRNWRKRQLCILHPWHGIRRENVLSVSTHPHVNGESPQNVAGASQQKHCSIPQKKKTGTECQQHKMASLVRSNSFLCKPWYPLRPLSYITAKLSISIHNICGEYVNMSWL